MPTTAQREFSLLIDVGNTFLKWGLFRADPDGGARENRVESGHALHDEIMALPAQFAKLPTPSKIVISNVAGTRIRSATIRVLEVWPDAPTPYWLVPQDDAMRRHQQLPQSGAAGQRPLGRADRRAIHAGRARGDGRRVRHRDDASISCRPTACSRAG